MQRAFIPLHIFWSEQNYNILFILYIQVMDIKCDKCTKSGLNICKSVLSTDVQIYTYMDTWQHPRACYVCKTNTNMRMDICGYVNRPGKKLFLSNKRICCCLKCSHSDTIWRLHNFIKVASQSYYADIHDVLLSHWLLSLND
jgi:hypothetical protein